MCHLANIGVEPKVWVCDYLLHLIRFIYYFIDIFKECV